MSMTIYPITGAAQTLEMSEPKIANGLVKANTGGYPSSAGGGGALELSQDRSVTTAGATRVMIKLSLKTPWTTSNADPTPQIGTMSAHTVVTVPKVMANALVYENSGISDPNVATTVVWLLAALNAVVQNKSIPALPSVSFDLPMIAGLVGGMPLNLASGSYGSAS